VIRRGTGAPLYSAAALVEAVVVYHVHKNQMRGNTACTGQRGLPLRGVQQFQAFFGFEFILLPIIVHARPPASNANRRVALCVINRRL